MNKKRGVLMLTCLCMMVSLAWWQRAEWIHNAEQQRQWLRVANLAAMERRHRLFAHRQCIIVDDQLGHRTGLRSLPSSLHALHNTALEFLNKDGDGDDATTTTTTATTSVRLTLANGKLLTEQSALDSLCGDKVHKIYASVARTREALDRLQFVGDSLRTALVYLCTDLDNLRLDLIGSVATVRRNIIDALIYDPIVQSMDIVIFENWRRRGVATAEKWRREVRQAAARSDNSTGNWLGRFRFVDVTRHFPDSLPPHVAKMPARAHKDGRTCAGLSWARNYLHMCRFFVSQIWRTEPVLGDYDFFWRIDTDSTFPTPVDYNLVRAAAHRNKTFAYYNRNERESPGCLIGLHEAIEQFGEQHGIEPQHRQAITNVTTYTGAFGIFRVAYFLHDSRWLALTATLDQLGGVYLHRWGEQDVFAPAFALLLPFENIGWVSDIVMHHKGYLQPNLVGIDSHRNQSAIDSLSIHKRLKYNS